MEITKGEWKHVKWNDKGVDRFHIRTEQDHDKLIATVHCWRGHIGERETKANAKLIADAGTTYNKCGLLPSELLSQRDELLEALKVMTHLCRIKYGNLDKEVHEEILKSQEAIKKATKQ